MNRIIRTAKRVGNPLPQVGPWKLVVADNGGAESGGRENGSGAERERGAESKEWAVAATVLKSIEELLRSTN